MLTASQLLSVTRARWRLGLSLFTLGLAVAVGLSLVLPKRWTATASVVIDVKATDPIAGGTSAAVLAPSYMATQVDIMQSERVALRVVQSLQLSKSPQLRSEFENETSGQGDYDTWLARLLQRRLEVRPVRESNILNVEFSSVDPRFAATVANGFAQAYLDTVLDLRVEPARRYTEFFLERAKALREQLESAQARLSEFQRERGILAVDERLDIETARLSELSSQVVLLQAASADGRSRQVAASVAPDSLPEVVNHPAVQALRAEITRQEARAREISERLGESHPTLQESRSVIPELRARLQQETQRLAASVSVSAILSESREAQVREALAAQRQRVLQFRGDRDALTVLQRDVELAQRAYDAVAARLTQMTLESESEQTNASLLNAATPPTRAAFPNWPLSLVMGVFGGLLLAVAGVLGREAGDRRVRSIEDVVRELRLPVLGDLLPAGRADNSAVELLRTGATGDR